MSKLKKLLPFILAFLLVSSCITFFTKDNNIKSEDVTNWEDLDNRVEKTDFLNFQENVDNGKIEIVYAEFNEEVYAKTMYYKLKNDKTVYETDNPQYETFKKELLKKNITLEDKSKVFDNFAIYAKGKKDYSIVFQLVIDIGFIVFLLYMFKNMPGLNMDKDKIYTITNNRDEASDDTTENQNDNELDFETVGGLKEVKRDLVSVVDFIKNPKKYKERDAKLPRGVLLVGPPGTGKTLLAKVIAKRAGIPFIYVNGSDFVEMYVGRGAARVRSLFKEARNQAPCIVFIDEIDSLCGKRGGHDSHSEDRKTLTALLAEMDGFNESSNILIIGATNRVEDIDKAALRPGRFTEIFHVPIPETMEERMEVVNIYAKNKKFGDDVDLREFCHEMIGRSPAEIEAVLNEATIISVQKNIGYITKDCIEEAFYKRVMQGHQKDNKETDPVDLKTIAYHEAGHTLIAKLHGGQVTKVTITPSTSGAGGVTFIQPPERKLYSKTMLLNKVKELYGGKVGEYLLNNKDWNKTTGGCSNDIEQATEILKEMVEVYGMSDYGLVNMNVLSKRTAKETNDFVFKTSNMLLKETIKEMEENFDKLEALANALLEHETIYEKEIDKILQLPVLDLEK